jgi:hypothetical protein
MIPQMTVVADLTRNEDSLSLTPGYAVGDCHGCGGWGTVMKCKIFVARLRSTRGRRSKSVELRVLAALPEAQDSRDVP